MLTFTKPLKRDYLYIRLNNVYQGIRRRCTDPTHENFKYYGAKGATLEWQSLQDFIKDVDRIDGWDLSKFLGKELQLDKDLKGGGCYSLKNCTWLSPEENRRIEFEQAGYKTINAESPVGELFTLKVIKAFCREHGLASTSVFKALRGEQKTVNGWLFWRNNTEKPERPTVYRITKPDSSCILFDNYAELASYGINENRIRECVKGQRPHTKEGLTAEIVHDRATTDAYWFHKNKRRLNKNV